MPTIHHLDKHTTVPMFEELETYYHDIRSKTAKQAMATRVEAGECPGKAPIGYLNVVDGTRRTVAIDHAIAPLIVEAFQLAAQRKSSLRKIVTELTPRGLVGQSGKPMGLSSLQVVLTNPFYAGLIRHQGQFHRGVHQPLINRSLFDRVQSRLFRRRCR